MDKRTLEALKGSIAKWEGIVKGEIIDEGTSNCPLCVKFFCNICEGCPVKEYTGFPSCDKTPYWEWDDLFEMGGVGNTATTKQQIKAAQNELDFLKSLLPEGE